MKLLKRTYALLEKEFIDFYTSKAWIIVIVLPLFIWFLYAVVYKEAEAKNFTIAYISPTHSIYQKVFANPSIKLVNYNKLANAKDALTNAKVDAIILDSPAKNHLHFRLLVDKSRAKEAAFVVNAINVAFLQAYSNNETPRIQVVYSNKTIATRWLSLPVWLIQIILTVCLLQAAANIADEKERQTLHSLLVSPMTLGDYLNSKVIWNSLVGLAALLVAVFLIGAPINLAYVIVFGIIGSAFYTVISVLIGVVSPNALFARTLATLAYIISALPMMVRDLPFAWKNVLNVFPSFLILLGYEQSLLVHPLFDKIIPLIAYLLLEIFFVSTITYFTLKHRSDF